jgi:hypothetical protein
LTAAEVLSIIAIDHAIARLTRVGDCVRNPGVWLYSREECLTAAVARKCKTRKRRAKKR